MCLSPMLASQWPSSQPWPSRSASSFGFSSLLQNLHSRGNERDKKDCKTTEVAQIRWRGNDDRIGEAEFSQSLKVVVRSHAPAFVPSARHDWPVYGGYPVSKSIPQIVTPLCYIDHQIHAARFSSRQLARKNTSSALPQISLG